MRNSNKSAIGPRILFFVLFRVWRRGWKGGCQRHDGNWDFTWQDKRRGAWTTPFVTREEGAKRLCCGRGCAACIAQHAADSTRANKTVLSVWAGMASEQWSQGWNGPPTRRLGWSLLARSVGGAARSTSEAQKQ